MESLEMRDLFFREFLNLAKNNDKYIILSNDFGAPALDAVRQIIPKQYINAGISEQNIISVASGMAILGFRPIVYSIASFITLRALEQIKIDLCDMNLPVVIVGVGAGYGYSMDGPTHHATEDIGIISSLSNIKIFSPADDDSVVELSSKILSLDQPAYLRLDRGQFNNIAPKINSDSLSAGFRVIKSGSKGALLASGNFVHKALEVASILALGGIDLQVFDIFEINAISRDPFINCMRPFKNIFIMEEQVENAGLSSLVMGSISRRNLNTSIHGFGIPMGVVYSYGDRVNLHLKCGLDSESIAAKILRILSE
jgi:transketolase